MRPAKNAAAALCGYRTHAHYGALLARPHVRDDGPRHVVGAAYAGVHHEVVVGLAAVHQAVRLADSGIVDQDVDPAEGVQHALHGRSAGGLVADIAGQTQMQRTYRARGLLGGHRIEVQDRDARALIGKAPGGGLTDAAQ